MNFRSLFPSNLAHKMNFRIAKKTDLTAIVSMLADDQLGQSRERFENPLPESYYKAFDLIERDPHQELIVVENSDKEVVGTLQLSFITYLTYQGGIRAQIESVRIRKDSRGIGMGKKMFLWAINRSKEKGAHLVQLTTDKKRPKSKEFYEKFGFKASHEGMKLHF